MVEKRYAQTDGFDPAPMQLHMCTVVLVERPDAVLIKPSYRLPRRELDQKAGEVRVGAGRDRVIGHVFTGSSAYTAHEAHIVVERRVPFQLLIGIRQQLGVIVDDEDVRQVQLLSHRHDLVPYSGY